MVVFVALVELGDAEIFVDALVVGLDRFDLGSLRWTEVPSGDWWIAVGGGSAAGVASGSAGVALGSPLLELELLELLLESSPGSLGGG